MASVIRAGHCGKLWASVPSLFCNPGVPSGFPWAPIMGPWGWSGLGTQLGLQRAPAPPPGATLLLQGHRWRPHLQHRDLPWPGPDPGSSAPELGFKLCQLESACLRVLASWRRQTLHWLARWGKHSGQDPVSRAVSQPTELAAGDGAGRPAKHGALLALESPLDCQGKESLPHTRLVPFERAWPCPQRLLLKG